MEDSITSAAMTPIAFISTHNTIPARAAYPAIAAQCPPVCPRMRRSKGTGQTRARCQYTSNLYALVNLRITVRTQTLLERVERISGLLRDPL